MIMKKTISKSMSWLLSVVMVFVTMISLTGITASAYTIPDESRFAEIIKSLRSQFPEYYSGTYYENGVAKAWQCFGYAAECFEQVFGIQFYNDGFYNRKDYTMGELFAGDFVRTDNDGHSIFITKVDGDRIYYTEANYWPAQYGPNKVRWDVSISYSELQSKFTYKVHVPENHLKGITKPVPKPATLSATIGTNFAPTKFVWNATDNTTQYALKIWKGTCWEGPSYAEFSVYDTSYSVDLPAGYYEAYVDSINENGWICSNVIKFTVKYGNPYDSGDDFYANIVRKDDRAHLSDVNGNVIIKNDGNKLWHFTKTSDGGYFIQNVATGKYLDVSNAVDKNGTNVQTCNYNGSNAQVWFRYGRSGEYLKPKCTSDRVLDIERASGNAHIWDLYYNDNQKFAILIYDKFEVIYDLNGGTGKIDKQIKIYDNDITITDKMPTRDGYEFSGWSKDKNATTAQYQPGDKYTSNESITLYAIWKESKITLNTTALTIEVGKSYTLNAAITPASYATSIQWTSDNSNVATVDNGIVKAVAAGTAKVTAKISNGKTATCTVTVVVPSVQALSNTSTISSKSITRGSSITVKAKATGGTAPYTYAVYYKVSSSDKLITVQSYNANDTVSFKPESAGKYDVYVKVKDSKGTIDKKYFTVNVTKELVSKSTLSATTVQKGSSVTVTAKAIGGIAPYNYAVYYKKTSSDNWITAQSYNANASISFKPVSAGKYDIYVKVKDSKGTIAKQYFTVNVISELVSKSTLSATTVQKGSSVTVKASATGGTAPYTYAVYYKKTSSDNWITVQSYNANATVSFKPESVGKYDVYVKVKDSNGTIAKQYLIVDVIKELVSKSTLSAATIKKGQSVTVTAKATGGTAPYTYAVYYKASSSDNWITVQSYNANTTISFKPSSVGKNDVCVKIKDGKGAIAKQYFTVNVTNELINKSTLSATTIKRDSSVTITAKAVGGKAPYTYAIYYKASSSDNWITAQAYDTNTTINFKPGSAAKYDICVKVKDSSGKIVKKNFTLTVTK